jgi:hypothetical protein
MLPSDPDGYTVSGQCVAVHRISASEERVMRSMNIKASPPGGLVALLAKHVADERLGSSMRWTHLNPEPEALGPEYCTLNTKHYTQHTTHYTLNTTH